MSNKIIKKAAACGLSAVMAFGLVAVTEAPKTAPDCRCRLVLSCLLSETAILILLQLENASLPIRVTQFEIVMSVKLSQ